MKLLNRYSWLISILGLILLLGLIFFWVKPLLGDQKEVLDFTDANSVRLEDVVPPNTQPEELKILAFGDMMLDRNVGKKIKNNELSFLFNDLEKAGLFVNRDLIMANLEGAVTNQGAHYAPQNAYDFAFSPELIAQLKPYGFNFFNLANNHFSDQGEKGVKETRDNLTALGIDHSGSVDAQADGNSVIVKEIQNQEVALVGLSMVYNHFDLAKAVKIIKEQKAAGHLVVVSIHWGTEYQHQYNKIQENIGHSLVDAGADIIIGHHPHVIQGMEIYNNHPIFYSLGNFIFDQYFSADTQNGLALLADYNSGAWTLRLVPLKSIASVPKVMTASEANVLWSKFFTWSKLSATQQDALKKGELIISEK
ncbi:MAG TPA: CapA family protein [bacterium]|nr:CapA family protein [bacterium]HPT29356.1 CapA family protein [bacterium]